MYEIIMQLPFNGFHVKGIISLPVQAQSLIIFPHGIDSSHNIPHEAFFAGKFQEAGLGTVVLDMSQEEAYSSDYHNIDLMSHGLLSLTNWLHHHSEYRDLKLAYFGSGTAAAVAIKAAAQLDIIGAIVCLSGRLELATKELKHLNVPTMLIAGELDFKTVKVNQKAIEQLEIKKQLAIVPGASHLFEEPRKSDEAAKIAISWFTKQLSKDVKPAADNTIKK